MLCLNSHSSVLTLANLSAHVRSCGCGHSCEQASKLADILAGDNYGQILVAMLCPVAIYH